MSMNPINLGVRFVLELAMLYGLGLLGWKLHTGGLRYFLMIALPLLGALLWGTFRVPGETISNGNAPIPVPGWVRLLIELALFTLATWAFFASGAVTAGRIFGGVTLLHYLFSYDRVIRLLRPGVKR